MNGWTHYAFNVCIAGAAISWLAAIAPFVRVAREFSRASKTGELHPIPTSGRGLPPVVIFTKNILPRVEKDRRRLARAIAAFIAFWATAAILGVAFSHPHP
jgi:hypothetical protein